METTADTSAQLAENESIRKLTQRSLSLATASLAVVVLMMMLSLTLVVGLASSAQNDAENASVENADLRIELTCRSLVAGDYAVASGRLSATIAEALVMLSRGESLNGVEIELLERSADLEAAAALRESAAVDCLTESD